PRMPRYCPSGNKDRGDLAACRPLCAASPGAATRPTFTAFNPRFAFDNPGRARTTLGYRRNREQGAGDAMPPSKHVTGQPVAYCSRWHVFSTDSFVLDFSPQTRVGSGPRFTPSDMEALRSRWSFRSRSQSARPIRGKNAPEGLRDIWRRPSRILQRPVMTRI